MNYLNDEQVAQEVADIKRHELWPLWPVLPMKELGGDRVGILVSSGLDTGVAEPMKIYLINLLELKAGQLGPQVEGKEVLEFATVEEAVREGWVGD